jgi:carbamoyltransferase
MKGHHLGWAGKFMGYAGVGKPEPVFELQAERVLAKFFEYDCISESSIQSVWRNNMTVLEADGSAIRDSVEKERAMAASIQLAWMKKSACIVSTFVEAVGRDAIDGVVLSGGGALNVLANQFIYDEINGLSSITNVPGDRPVHELPVFVPSAPGDNGVPMGSLFTDGFTEIMPNNTQYLGFKLWDESVLSDAVREWDAQPLSSLGGVEYLAELLAGGEAWRQQRKSNASRPIIAIVRGRQEVGPRALGHRSLVAVPDAEEIRDRMNVLKYRAWWRPAAPMIADEALEEVFGRVIKSPYMTMAPRVRDEIKYKYPGIAHFDFTARHQSVGKQDEPWVHALLLAVGRRTGLAALINTSFNRKGKPIVNTVKECLAMLSEEKDLDYVLIEDFLFQKK